MNEEILITLIKEGGSSLRLVIGMLFVFGGIITVVLGFYKYYTNELEAHSPNWRKK